MSEDCTLDLVICSLMTPSNVSLVCPPSTGTPRTWTPWEFLGELSGLSWRPEGGTKEGKDTPEPAEADWGKRVL